MLRLRGLQRVLDLIIGIGIGERLLAHHLHRAIHDATSTNPHFF